MASREWAIRAYARRSNRRLTDVAQLVVTDLPALPDLARPDERFRR